MLLVHAVNPHGFATLRRVNESNVDLNRNFLRHPEEHVANPDYDALGAAINPDRLDPESDAAARSALAAFAERHGFPRLQQALTRGQYAHPHGLYYGGARDEASAQALREVALRDTRGARRIAWVDVHTGLGPWGEVEMILEFAPDDPRYRRAKATWGDVVRTTATGESVSTAVHGSMDRGIAALLGGPRADARLRRVRDLRPAARSSSRCAPTTGCTRTATPTRSRAARSAASDGGNLPKTSSSFGATHSPWP